MGEAQESTPTKTIKTGVGEPPDGGFAAWLQVLGGFFIFFNSWYAIHLSMQ
jgi:hypothetical protein